MMVLDLHICYIASMGMVLLAFAIGGLLYATPRFAPAHIRQVDPDTNGSVLAAMGSLAPFWQGGCNGKPRPRLLQRRWASLLTFIGSRQ